MDVMAVTQQVASTNTQLRYRLPKVFGSLFCKCGSHSAVDNTKCFFNCFFLLYFPPQRSERSETQEDEKNLEPRLRGTKVVGETQT